MRDLERHQTNFVGIGFFIRRERLARARAVEIAADRLQRTERHIRYHGSQYQRTENRDNGEEQSLLESRRQFVTQENGGDADMNTAESLPAHLEPDAGVINVAGRVNKAQLMAESCVP